MRHTSVARLTAACLLAAAGAPALLAGPADGPVDPNAERIEITATRIPEDVDTVPGSLTIVTGQDLRARGVQDLRGALQLAAGIDVAPLGDAGPSGSVPELWGLKELDAFLLVVDGVPWGGAFVPAVTTLDLTNVERIEIQRGPAPVMYGATSFVGVIHVIHREPGAGGSSLETLAGSYGTRTIGGRVALRPLGSLRSTVSGSAGRDGFDEDRTRADRGRLSWRGHVTLPGGGLLRLAANGFWNRQDPASPHPRVGDELSQGVPIGANHNPRGSHLDEQRIQVSAGMDRPAGQGGLWSTEISFVRSAQEALRGFLTDVSAVSPNANGFREDLDFTDLYVDTHLAFGRGSKWRAVAGIDHLFGRGFAQGGDFDYTVDLDGTNAPDGEDLKSQSDVRIRDVRNFSGLYGQLEWLASERWRVQIGARLNRTGERRTARALEFAAPPAAEAAGSEALIRGSGSAGVTFTAWRHGEEATRLYAVYSNAFKPAAIDFSLDAVGEILSPETAVSLDVGTRSRLAGGALGLQTSFFQMDFENLVVSQSIMGLPSLVNAGKERFRGAELEVDWRILRDLRWRAVGSIHDARFRDFVTEFGGVPAQLAGNRLEMSARNMAATGLVYAPERGWAASAQVGYVGSRYLNKRNTALAPGYTTWSGGVAYRSGDWQVRLDGINLNDQRPSVTESELGDAQYYRLPGRRLVLSAVWSLR